MMSKTEDSQLDSGQESARTGDPQATAAQYIQSHPKAVETGQANKKICPGLTKPFSSLPTLTAARHFIYPLIMLKWAGLIASNEHQHP